MAHFAKIKNNKVVQVLVVPDNQETRGGEFLSQDLGLGGTWVQTSYNNNLGGKFAGVGDDYDPTTLTFSTPIIEKVEVPELTIIEKLEAMGLTVEDLKALLG
jgi:hypothetical protein